MISTIDFDTWRWKLMSQFRDAFHRIGFWFLVVFLIGISTGGYMNYKFNEWQMQRNIQLKGLIFQGDVYNLSIRP
jgi:hypothetical protein